MKKIGIIILVVAVIGIAVYFFMKNKKSKETGPLDIKADLSKVALDGKQAKVKDEKMSLVENPATCEPTWKVNATTKAGEGKGMSNGNADLLYNPTRKAGEGKDSDDVPANNPYLSEPRTSNPNLSFNTGQVTPRMKFPKISNVASNIGAKFKMAFR